MACKLPAARTSSWVDEVEKARTTYRELASQRSKRWHIRAGGTGCIRNCIGLRGVPGQAYSWERSSSWGFSFEACYRGSMPICEAGSWSPGPALGGFIVHLRRSVLSAHCHLVDEVLNAKDLT